MSIFAELEDYLEATFAGKSGPEAENSKQLAEKTAFLLANLCLAHWPSIYDLLESNDSGKAAFSVSVKLEQQGADRKVAVKISYAKKTSDSAEQTIKGGVEKYNEET